MNPQIAYELQVRFESRQVYWNWASEHPVEAHQRNPDLFWQIFGHDFEKRGFTRSQVDKVMESRHEVQPS